jgi:hypothetical protein
MTRFRVVRIREDDVVHRLSGPAILALLEVLA